MAVGYITVNPDSPQSYSVEIKEGAVVPIGRKPAPDGSFKVVLQVPEVSAQAAYATARVQLDVAAGTTLQNNSVEFDEAKAGRVSRAPSTPPAAPPNR